MKGKIKGLMVWLLVLLITFGGMVSSVSAANENHDPVYPGLSTWKIDPPVNGSKDGITVTFKETNDGGTVEKRYVSWTASPAVQVRYVWVKASNAGILYSYTNQTSGTDLYGPLTQKDWPHEISHIVIYYEPAAPRLSIQKEASVQIAKPGDSLEYTITVTNSGGPATNVQVTDLLPNLVLPAANEPNNWTPVSNPNATNEYKQPAFAMGAGETRVIKLQTVISEQLAEVQAITNTASVTCDGMTNPLTANAVVNIEYPQEPTAPILNIVKTADKSTVALGEILTYTIKVTNTGNAAANGVRIVEAVPSYTELAEGADTAWQADGATYYQVIDVPAGQHVEKTFKVKVKGSPTDANVNSIANTAGASCEGLETITAKVTVPIQYKPLKPVLERVVNNGDGTFTAYWGYLNENAEAVAALRSDFTGHRKEGSPNPPTQNFLPGRNRDVFSTIFDGTNLVWTLKGPDGGQRTATASGTNTPPVEEPDLMIDKTADKILLRDGDVVTYTITVTNNGGKAMGVKVKESLPQYTEIAEGNPDYWKPIEEANQYIYEIGQLNKGESKTATFRIKFKANKEAVIKEIQNTAKATYEGAEGWISDQVTLPVDISYPVPSISKSDGGISAKPGDIFTYTITVATNNASMKDAYILESPDINTEYAGGPEWTLYRTNQDGSKVYRYIIPTQASIASLAIQASDPVIPGFKVKVKETVASAVQQVTNTAVLYYSNGHVDAHDSTPIIRTNNNNNDNNNNNNNSGNDTPAPQGKPDLIVTKTDKGAAANLGSLVEYFITVENKGNAPAQGVKVYEMVPLGMIAPANSNIDWIAEGNQFVYNLGTLNVGEKRSLKFVLQVSPTLPAGVEKVINEVVVKDNGVETATSDNKASDDTPIFTVKAVNTEPPAVTPPTPSTPPAIEQPAPEPAPAEPNAETPDLPFTGGAVELELLLAGLGVALMKGGLLLKRR